MNGALVASAPYDVDFAPSQETFHLGNRLVGAIDEVRLYARVLSGAEIEALE